MTFNKHIKNIFKTKIFDVDIYSLRGIDFHKSLLSKRKKNYEKFKNYLSNKNNLLCRLCSAHLNLNNVYYAWKEYKLLNCKKCGSVNTNINFKKFRPEYFHDDINKKIFVNKFIKKNFLYRSKIFGKERIQYIIDKIKKKKNKLNVLDFACGYGSFLHSLKKEKICYKGIDFDIESINFCKKMNLNAEATSIDQEVDNFYDIITFFDAIEHLYNPQKIIFSALKKLKKGGHLVFFTPNLNSLSTALMKFDHNKLSVFDHVCFYNEKSFDFIINKFKLKLISYEYFGLDIKDYFQMLEFKYKNIKFNQILRNFSNLTQTFVDQSKASNSMRIILEK